MNKATELPCGLPVNLWSRFCLTRSEIGRRLGSVMPSAIDTVHALHRRLEFECSRIAVARGDLASLAGVYQQYVDTSRLVQTRRRRIQVLKAILGNEEYRHARAAYPEVEEQSDVWESPSVIRNGVALWEAIEQLLLSMNEATTADIQGVLGLAGFSKLTKQAIDSAVKSHADLFKIVRRGNQRFIALKMANEEDNAAATSKRKK